MSNWFAPVMNGEVTYEEIQKKAENGEFHEWNYEAMDFTEYGYEDLMDKLKSYTAVEYLNWQKLKESAEAIGDTEKEAQYRAEMDRMVNEVYDIYRTRDVYPTAYFSELGIMQEIEKCIAYKAFWTGNVVSCGAGVGTTLCKFLFPNLQDTPSKHDLDKKGAESIFAKFHNEAYLKRAIRFCFSYKNGCPVPTSVEGGLRLVGSAPSNFRPMNAKAIYERFCPEGGTIYDFCSGFGGRLLGALSSKKNFRYIGTDPNTETMYHLHQLGEYIEMVTGREDSYELHCCGSEELIGPPNSIDFAFSSPPYFDLEVYSDEPTQCYNKFPKLEEWIEGYVRATIKNIVRMLKPGHVYAVNIADFDCGSTHVAYVDEWIRISTEEGAPLYDTVYLGVTARAGSAEQAAGELKKENILVFKKPLYGRHYYGFKIKTK